MKVGLGKEEGGACCPNYSADLGRIVQGYVLTLDCVCFVCSRQTLKEEELRRADALGS